MTAIIKIIVSVLFLLKVYVSRQTISTNKIVMSKKVNVGCNLFKTFFITLRFSIECHGRKTLSIYLLTHLFPTHTFSTPDVFRG